MTTIKQTLASTSLVAAAFIAASASAELSTPNELKGYNACLEAAELKHDGLVPNRHYLLDRSGDGNTFYVNATAWHDGDRTRLRISCDTRSNGRLQTVSIEEGSFTARASVVEIAAK